jgi:hypothetical protein
MPRNGSGVYNHPFPDVVEGTTIESAVFNGNTSDVEQDLNTPRPIVAGGTGANNARDAMINLKGEIAAQFVDNYDTFPFVDGDFYSQPGATNAFDNPGGASGAYIAGICYGSGLSAMMLEARNLGVGPNVVWYRSKVGGIWSAWAKGAGSEADLDARYVNLTGDVMTGSLSTSLHLVASGVVEADGGFRLRPGVPFAQGDANFTNIFNATADYASILIAGSGVGSINYYRADMQAFQDKAGGTAGTVYIAGTSPSASTATGALQVAGGVGVAGIVNANGLVAHGADIYAMSPHAVGQPNVGAFCSDYFTAPTYTGTMLRQFDHGVTGADWGGLPNGGLGLLLFQNGTNCVVGNNTATPIHIMPGTVKAFSVSTTGVNIPLTGAGALTVSGGVQIGGATEFVGNSHWQFAGIGAGGWYDSVSGPNKFYVGTDNALDVYRIYTASSGNAFSVNVTGQVSINNNIGSSSPSTGGLVVSGGAGVSGDLRSGAAIVASGAMYAGFSTAKNGTYYFGNDMSCLINHDTANNFSAIGGIWNCQGLVVNGTTTLNGSMIGNVTTTGAFCSQQSTDVGAFYFGSFGGMYISGVNSSQTVTFGGVADITCATARIKPLGIQCRGGSSGGFGANLYNLLHSGGPVSLWIDASNMGTINVTSDYRIKKDVIDLPGMWDTVKALRPIKYTQAQFSPPSHVDFVKEQAAKAAQQVKDGAKAADVPPPPGHLFEADDIERWGFIAHELQDTLPSMAEGVKDSPDTVQSLNLAPVVAALTKALQEAMTRIEALEGGAARRR